MVNPNRFYTYAFLREDRTPYYIGKGIGNRIYSTNRRIKPPKDKRRTIYLKQNLTEEEAFKHEIYMIDVFGRKDLGTGILHNRTNGGEGTSGWVPSEETRRKMSESNKNPSEETRRKMSEAHKGKTLSKEHRKKLSEANKNKIVSEETRRKMSESNKNPSEETRRKMSQCQIGKTHSDETKKRMSEAKKNPSEETRRKMSEAHKGKICSEETRKKRSENIKGRKWWNDSCGNTKFAVECPGNDWRLGRKSGKL